MPVGQAETAFKFTIVGSCPTDCAVFACRAKYQDEIKQLEKAREDLQLEQTFLLDKFRQLRAENDRLKAEVDAYKGRLNHATQDYVSSRVRQLQCTAPTIDQCLHGC